MVQIGQYNNLTVVKKVNFGYYLDGEHFGEILLPNKQASAEIIIGEAAKVFLYTDSEDRLVATMQRPKAIVGECAYLKVIETNRYGAFLDWGLSKDLLVPFNQQHKPMEPGYSYTVYLFVDEASERIAASSRLEDHLAIENGNFEPKQSVELMIYSKSDLGFKAVINGTHLGQLYDNEVFRNLHYGENIEGFIKQIRSDGRIDLCLQPPVHMMRDSLANQILQHLEQNQGLSSLTDKSPPEDIYRTYGVSKGSYKKTLGLLYKNRKILIEKHQISLLDNSSE